MIKKVSSSGEPPPPKESQKLQDSKKCQFAPILGLQSNLPEGPLPSLCVPTVHAKQIPQGWLSRVHARCQPLKFGTLLRPLPDHSETVVLVGFFGQKGEELLGILETCLETLAHFYLPFENTSGFFKHSSLSLS